MIYTYGIPIRIYRLSTVVDSGGIGFFDKLVERNIESPTRKAREILLIF